jgi:CubicO group peptidase (beta-lactamase class C family)
MLPFHPEAAAERLSIAFAELIAETPCGGASLAVWHEGKPILSLSGGEASPGLPWTESTPCLIWSASKGVAAACALHALQEQGIALERPVPDLWPEFAAEGKGEITLAQLLSHQGGLAAIDRKGLSITDHEAVVSALAEQPPNWILDGSHGYGARTFGFLLDEIVRRVSGITLGESWNEIFREPLGLDLWFGVPEEKLPAVATVIAPKTTPAPSDFSRAFGDPSSLTRRALSEPNSKLGTLTPSVMNTPEMRMASIPSLGAIATAGSLARFYAMLAGDGGGFFSLETLSAMQTTLTRGLDRVLLQETSFSAGFMTNDFGVYGPSQSAFGHPGAGGSLGFADPELGLGFAFIPSAMNPGALPGPRTRKFVQALYGTEESA